MPAFNTCRQLLVGRRVWRSWAGVAPLGGTFTVTYGGNTTAALAADASGADVTAALNALPSIAGTPNVRVSGVEVLDGALLPRAVNDQRYHVQSRQWLVRFAPRLASGRHEKLFVC